MAAGADVVIDVAIRQRIQSASPPWGRLVQLIMGLVLFGTSLALLVRSELGLDPWDVFHQGLSLSSGIPIGVCTILAGAIVLTLWLPLHQRPGLGTVANVILVGVSLDFVLSFLPTPDGMQARWAFLLTGIALNGVATGAYIGAGLGAGPRDGLMVGLAARGFSLRVARTVIEVAVLVAGFLLGGTVGIGTLLYALMIGPIVHVTIPALSHRAARERLLHERSFEGGEGAQTHLWFERFRIRRPRR
jgi:uncharacterized membrane protein YczE